MTERAREAAVAALEDELDRRHAVQRAESERLYGHPGAWISSTHMSREEQYEFLFDAYDKARAAE